jgi:hypothetical protein
VTRRAEDEPRARLKEFEKTAERESRVANVPYAVRDINGKRLAIRTEPKSNIDWSQCPPDARASEANVATTLRPFGYDDRVLGPVFERFHLDARNPWDWRRLVTIFVEAHYPNQRVWTPERLHELWANCAAIVGVYPELAAPRRTAALIRELRKEHPEKYDPPLEDEDDVDGMRKPLKDAVRLYGRLC